jgi:small conductance mechanosensitive channel
MIALAVLPAAPTAQRPWAVPKLLHDHTKVLVEIPLRILLILVLALIIRFLAHRAINRLTKAAINGALPAALGPLKDKARVASLLELSPLQSERRRQRAETIGSVLRSAVSAAVFVVALLMIVAECGLSLAPLIAGTSIVGVALGFGAQNIVKDFLGGMFMILEDQYGVGDAVDVGAATGTVEAVGLRTTRLRDVHGTVWYVRNGEIIRVGNKSQGYAQVVLDVPIAPNADADRASATMLAVATALAAEPEWADAFLAPPEVWGIEELTQKATTIRLAARTRPTQQYRVARELRKRIRQQMGSLVVDAALIVPDHPVPPTSSAQPAEPTADA